MANQILTSSQRSKQDKSPDSLFYSKPRYVNHLDLSFRNKLTELYRELILPNSTVLDLMSSWVSHLPEVSYNEVIGHGLNSEELSSNYRLDRFWIQDLNLDQTLPLSNNSIDYCLVVAGWQYLQYPENISEEILRITKPSGQIIISFSDRAFWSKSPNIWLESNDEQRINYVSSVLSAHGWIIDKTYRFYCNQKFFNIFKQNPDPFFAVLATKPPLL